MIHRAARAFPRSILMLCLVLAGAALAAPGSPTGFTRDPALFKAKVQTLVDAMRAQNPEMAKALQQAFSQDVIAQLQPSFREMGLDSNDMADMMTVYWVNAWEAAHGLVNHKTDKALITGARAQIADIMAKNAALARMTDAQRQDVADTMIIQALIVSARMEAAAKQGADVQRQMSDTIAQEAQQITKTDLRAVDLTAQGFRPKGSATATPAPPARGTLPAAAPAALGNGATPRHPENWQAVEGVYFRSYYTFGVGGMMIQDFQPVVLFRDGSYYRVEGPALEDIDLAAARASKPVRWGRWQKSGTGYVLIDEKGKASKPLLLQDGQFFKAYGAEAGGGKLGAIYTRVSGGGNTALGGDTIIASQTDLSFAPDGSFSREAGGGGSNSGQWTGASVATSSRSASAGRYQIRNHTITMTQPDGSTKREFFAFGSQKTPPRIDTEMMFIGDRVFTVMSRNRGR